jgi:segregation and condensation protein B
MSLKAKLEAVIYAAEEPVTLAQLASLFAVEALEWKAERAAEAAEAASDAANVESPSMLEEGFAYLGLEQTPASSTAEPSTAPEPALESANSAPVEAEAEPHEIEPAAEVEGDAKREARARDREVRSILQGLIDELVASFAADGRGIEIREIAGGYRMATKPECHDAVRLFVRSLKPPLKLSLPALETLAVVAYKQPVTAPEVSEIRGVESAGTLGSLLSRKLIATAGRKPVIGRPILYKTTREFLLRFGLKDVAELPSMEEFEKMAAIELDEQAPAEDGEVRVELRVEDTAEFEFDDSVEREDDELAGEAQKPVELQQGEFASADALQPAETEASPHER